MSRTPITPTPPVSRTTIRRLAAVVVALGALACSDASGPTAPITLPLAGEPAFDRFGPYGTWSTPENMGEPINAVVGSTRAPGMTPDGRSLYLSSDRSGTLGDLDFWVAYRKHDKDEWGVPQHLAALSSAAHDANPNFSPDGRTMLFNSSRGGGCGNQDLWMSTRDDIHDDFAWTAPVNLGCVINGPGIDQGPAYVRDARSGGEWLYYSTEAREGVLGLRDLFVSRRNGDGSWGAPTAVPELNSTFDEARPTIREDGLEIFFWSAGRPAGRGFAGFNVWTATRASIDDSWSSPVPVVPAQSLPLLSPDGNSLFTSTNRAGSPGVTDLYVSRRPRIPNRGSSMP